MRKATLLTLTLLGLSPFAAARRGGGGGDSDGDSSGGGGGGDDSSGSSGGSYDCPDSRVNQDAELYSGPTYSGYYDGQVTFKYRFSRVSTGNGPADDTPPSGSDCIYADDEDHTFVYDAVMNIGAVTMEYGILDFMFWELRAFVPWEAGSAGNNLVRREVLRLASLGYPDKRVRYPNGTVDEHVYSRETSWTIDISPERNATGNYSSVSVNTDFVYTPENDYGAPTTSNWIPLEGVCAVGYDYDNPSSASSIYFPESRPDSPSGPLLTSWIQPNVSDISANITGIGSDTVRFSLLNGKFENLIGGAQPKQPCYSTGGITWSDPPARWEPFVSGTTYAERKYWNASGEFEIIFEGTLNITASKPITGFNESRDFLPQWTSDSGRSLEPTFALVASGFLVLLSTFLLA